MIGNDTTAYQPQNSREFVARLRSARVPTTPSAKLLESAEPGDPMNLDLLAIAAHPDDVELTCGGTLLKMAQRGYKTGILDLSPRLHSALPRMTTGSAPPRPRPLPRVAAPPLAPGASQTR